MQKAVENMKIVYFKPSVAFDAGKCFKSSCSTCCNVNTKCTCRFHEILRVNSDYVLKQHKPPDLCNGYELPFV
jgi:hypothetical protein